MTAAIEGAAAARIAVTIAPATRAGDVAAVARLFRDYADGLGVDLSYQGFEPELAGLPGAYAPPGGALLIAWAGAAAVGCVALRPSGAGAEMKRLYVAPGGRGQGLGERLARAALADAARLGHPSVRLDTLPGMAAARALYRKLGFVPVPPYYAGAPAGTLFLALTLAHVPLAPAERHDHAPASESGVTPLRAIGSDRGTGARREAT